MTRCRDLAYHLFSIDTRSLALLRIGIAAVILLDLMATRLPDVDPFYGGEGMYPFSISRGPGTSPWHWSLHELDESNGFQVAMLGGAAVAALLLLAGCCTRAATAVSWILAVSLANRNPMVCNYGDSLLQIMLFWNLWIPWGETWSVDAWWRAGRPQTRRPRRRICSVATACAMLQLTVVYLFTGLFKLNHDWMSGMAIQHALELEYATRPSAQLLLGFPRLLEWLTYATLGLEILGPLLVWSPWNTARIRLALIAMFVTLHVGIELFFTAVFLSHVCIAAWSLFLPGSWWETAGLRRLSRVWDERMRRRAVRGDGHTRHESVAPHSTVRLGRARSLVSISLIALMAYILAWNVATFREDSLGFMMPARARWLGHVTRLKQTWDMFWVPSRYQAWIEARVRRADGSTVDMLGNERPAPVEPPQPNWASMPNSRWKLFFRRMTENPDPELCERVAEFLWREWNVGHASEQPALRLDLVLVRRLDGLQPGTRGILEQSVARRESPDANPLDALLRRLRGLDDKLLPRP